MNFGIVGQESSLDGTSGDRSGVDSSRFQGAQVRGKAILEKLGHRRKFTNSVVLRGSMDQSPKAEGQTVKESGAHRHRTGKVSHHVNGGVVPPAQEPQ